MDIGHLTDVLPYAFSLAANVSQTIIPPAIEAGQNVWVALTHHDAMPSADRTLQIAKIAGTTAILGISIMNGSFEGILACSITEGEALMELEKAGQHWRMTHCKTPPPQPLW